MYAINSPSLIIYMSASLFDYKLLQDKVHTCLFVFFSPELTISTTRDSKELFNQDFKSMWWLLQNPQHSKHLELCKLLRERAIFSM